MSRNQVGVIDGACIITGLAGMLLQQFIVISIDLQIAELEIHSLDPGTTVEQQHQAEWRAADPGAPVQTVEDRENQIAQLEQEARAAEDLGEAFKKVAEIGSEGRSESDEKQRASTAHPEIAKLEKKQAEEMEKKRGVLDEGRRALENRYADSPAEVRDRHLDDFNVEAARQLDAKATQHRQERDNLQAELMLSEPEQRDLWKRTDPEELDRDR